jgi:hypothetical protein
VEAIVYTPSKIIITSLATLLAIQLVPYGHHHVNPPVIREPVWNTPKTRDLARRACFDCHSNESVWPWYSRIAPVSWLVTHDIQAGRSKLNFSDWQDGNQKMKLIAEIVKEISDGEMPPVQYRMVHSSAGLSDDEKQQLIKWVRELK